MKKVVFLIIILYGVSVFGRNSVLWDFDTSSVFVSNDTMSFLWSDTTFLDDDLHSLSGLYKMNTTVGDSSYAYVDIGQYEIDIDYKFEFKTSIYISDLSLYSNLFFGFGDSSFSTPFDNSGASGIMVRFGKGYDGEIFGVCMSDGKSYRYADTVQSGLLEVGRTYEVVCEVSYNSVMVSLYSSSGLLLASVYVYDNSYSYQNNSLNYYVATIKGYSSDYGVGYASLECMMDSLYIGADTQSTSSAVNNADIGRNDGLSIVAFPNPFNPVVNISVNGISTGVGNRHAYSLQDAKISIYNINGKLVKTSSNATTIKWNAQNHPSGTYIVRAKIGEKVVNKKIMLLR